MIEAILFEDSLLFGTNAPFIEGLYEEYLQNPESVPPEWHEYFDKLRQAGEADGWQASQNVPYSSVVESFCRRRPRHSELAGMPAGTRQDELTWQRNASR